MNKTIKYYGIFLILFSFVTIVLWLYNLISSPNPSGVISVGIPIVLIAFVLFFFPGIYYFKVGKRQLEPSRTIKSAGLMGIIAFILLAILVFTLTIIVRDMEGFATMYAVFLSLIIYIVSTIMLIIGTVTKK